VRTVFGFVTLSPPQPTRVTTAHFLIETPPPSSFLLPCHPRNPHSIHKTNPPTHTRIATKHIKSNQIKSIVFIVPVVVVVVIPFHPLRQPVDPLALVDPLAVHVHGLGEI
jgi:hypothetical protein